MEIKEERREETRIVECKECGTRDTWTLAGRYPNGIKKWKDSTGATCNGKVCGSCNRKRAKAGMQKSRANKKLEQTIIQNQAQFGV